MLQQEIILDMRGKDSAEPIVEVKKAMEEDSSSYIKIIVDSDLCRDNLVKLGEYKGYENHVLEQEGNYIVVLIPPVEEKNTSVEENPFSKATSDDLGELNLEDIFENDFAEPLGKVITEPTIAGGDAPFYMSNGTGSLERSIAAYEKLKKEKGETVKTVPTAISLDNEIGLDSKGSTSLTYSTIVITKDVLQGADEMGLVWLQSFLSTFIISNSVPREIYFTQGAVKVLVEESPIYTVLTQLIEKGVQLYGCQVSLAYYGLSDLLTVGRVVSMVELAGKMMEKDTLIV